MELLDTEVSRQRSLADYRTKNCKESDTIEWLSTLRTLIKVSRGFLDDSVIKNLPVMQETGVESLVQEDPLEEEMVTHPSIRAWRIPRIEQAGGLQSMGSQRVGHNWTHNVGYTSLSALQCLWCHQCSAPIAWCSEWWNDLCWSRLPCAGYQFQERTLCIAS